MNGSVGIVVSFSTHKESAESAAGVAKVNESSIAPPPRAMDKDQPAFPVVRFTSGKTMLIEPVTFTVNNAHGDVEASREQVS